MKNATLEFVEDNKKEISELINSMVPFLKEYMAKYGNGSRGIVWWVSNTIDEYNEKLINHNTTCSRGCSFCCHDDVAVTGLEMDRIKWYMKKHKIRPNRKLLAKQSASHKAFMQLSFPDRKCSLLNERNECSIYPVRPFICRQYHSLDTPTKCIPDENGEISTGILRSTQIYALMTAMVIVDGSENSLKELHLELRKWQ